MWFHAIKVGHGSISKYSKKIFFKKMSNPTLPLNATPGASGNKRGRPKGSSKKTASRTASAKKIKSRWAA
jgi:hypothetical protein